MSRIRFTAADFSAAWIIISEIYFQATRSITYTHGSHSVKFGA